MPVAKKVWTVCSRGHRFQKSSAVPSCPICWPGRYKTKPKEKSLKTASPKKLPKSAKSAKSTLVKHADGTPWAKGKTVKGVPEGYWEWFRKDGSKMRSGYFAKGKQTGEWTTYNKQGKVYKITQIKNKAKK
jgi:antitoxin component YwqK of YwqJK toxin-antitoxin module